MIRDTSLLKGLYGLYRAELSRLALIQQDSDVHPFSVPVHKTLYHRWMVKGIRSDPQSTLSSLNSF